MSNEKNIKREKGMPTDGDTDYDRLEKMTEEEIEENAKSDADAPLLSDEELKRFKHVNSSKD
jgi:putative transcriptional regulator